MTLRVMLDARWLQTPLHGIARYTQALIHYLPADIQLDILYNRSDFEPFARERAIWIDTKIPLFSPDEPLRMQKLLKSLQPQLLHIPSFWRPYTPPCPWVITLHDLIHLLPPVPLKQQLYYRWLRKQLPYARALMTVSKSSAEALQQWGGGKLPINVSYLGTDPHYRPIGPDDASLRRQHWGLVSPYVLFVGNAKFHKQFALALHAAALAGEVLVSVGVSPSGQAHHRALHQIPDELMPVLYRGAKALLMPSVSEGFGLPGLEALACGTPVLASDLPIFHEILGPGAWFIKAPDPGLWAEAIRRIQDKHDREKLIQAGLTQATHYSWEKLGQQTAAVYRRCV